MTSEWLVQVPEGWGAKLQAAEEKLSCLNPILVLNDSRTSGYESDSNVSDWELMLKDFTRARKRAKVKFKTILKSRDVNSHPVQQIAYLQAFTQKFVSFTQSALAIIFDQDENGEDLDVKEEVEEDIANMWSNSLKLLLLHDELIIFGLRCMCESALGIYNDNDKDEEIQFGEDFGKTWENPPKGFRLARSVLDPLLQSDSPTAVVPVLRIMMIILSRHDVDDEGLAVCYLLSYLNEVFLRRDEPKEKHSIFWEDPDPLQEISLDETIKLCKTVFGDNHLESWFAALVGHATLIDRQTCPSVCEATQSLKRRRIQKACADGQVKHVWYKVVAEVDLFLKSQESEIGKHIMLRTMAKIHNPHFHSNLHAEEEDDDESGHPDSYLPSDAFSQKVHSWTELIGCMGDRGSYSPQDLSQFIKKSSQQTKAGLLDLSSSLLKQTVFPDVVPFLLDLRASSKMVMDVTIPWTNILNDSEAVLWIFQHMTPKRLPDFPTRDLGLAMLQSRNLSNIAQFVDFVGAKHFIQEADFMSDVKHLKFELLTKAHECASITEFVKMLSLRRILPAATTLEIASAAMQAYVREDQHRGATWSENPQSIFANLVASGDVAGCAALKDFMTLAWVVTRFKDLSDVCAFLGSLLGCPEYVTCDVVISSVQASNHDAVAFARLVAESSGHLYLNRKMQETERIKASTWIDEVLSVLRGNSLRPKIKISLARGTVIDNSLKSGK